MPNPYFHFKEFTIYHDQCAMKVGTDAVLLGAWALQNNPKYILDIGSGTGIIALMLAQRFNESSIDAIEIDEKAVNQAKENINNSKWAKRITQHQIALQEFQAQQKYDLIISNPPYFNNQHFAKGKERSQARHTSSLSFNELLLHAESLLNDNGSFHVIIPYTEAPSFIQKARICNLIPVKHTRIAHCKGKSFKRSLLSFQKKEAPMVESELYIKDVQSRFTDQYRALTAAFYLHF